MADETPSDQGAAIAHLLRRTTFGPAPGQVESLLGLSYNGVLDALLGRSEGDAVFDAPALDVPDAGEDDAYDQLTRWWVERMRHPWGGLHEKLVWFWHGHFTSSVDKCSAPSLVNQHRLVRRHALGNFRQFAREMVVDAAMMLYLDADGSTGLDPNENLARELMELFTIGRGNYTETDVKEAAKALSGWLVEWDTGEVYFESENAYPGAVRFLGTKGRFSAPDIVDILCDHPACALLVAAKLNRYLVGTDPTAERLDELAKLFRDANLEILPLVETILDGPEFALARQTRPKYSIEWFVAMANIIGVEPPGEESLWGLEALDQEPFAPPNVAGWIEGDAWLSPSIALAKSNLVFDMISEFELQFDFDELKPVPDVLAHCGIHEPSPVLVEALESAYWAPLDAADVNVILVVLALTSPDFALA